MIRLVFLLVKIRPDDFKLPLAVEFNCRCVVLVDVQEKDVVATGKTRERSGFPDKMLTSANTSSWEAMRTGVKGWRRDQAFLGFDTERNF